MAYKDGFNHGYEFARDSYILGLLSTKQAAEFKTEVTKLWEGIITNKLASAIAPETQPYEALDALMSMTKEAGVWSAIGSGVKAIGRTLKNPLVASTIAGAGLGGVVGSVLGNRNAVQNNKAGVIAKIDEIITSTTDQVLKQELQMLRTQIENGSVSAADALTFLQNAKLI